MRPAKLVSLSAPVLVAFAGFAGGLKSRASAPAARIMADTGGEARQDARAAIFVQRGCPECHAIAALGVKAATDVGPDLTFAYADVVNRYGMDLSSFLESSPGMMGFVFASHVHLTSTDQDSISRILHEVYREHLAEMDQEMPSFPPGRVRPRGRPGPL